MSEEEKNPFKPIEQQIQSLKELTAEQLKYFREAYEKDTARVTNSLADLNRKLESMGQKLEEKYVSKEYLAQVLAASHDTFKGEIQNVYERFNPIRTALIFIATTTGGVLLVAIVKFVFGGIAL